MAKILRFKKPKKRFSTDKEYFEYAEKTGCCPMCGSSLKVYHVCCKCGTVEARCSCGWGVKKETP